MIVPRKKMSLFCLSVTKLFVLLKMFKQLQAFLRYVCFRKLKTYKHIICYVKKYNILIEHEIRQK